VCVRSFAPLLRGPELGRGAFGIVYDGMWDGTRVAIKVVTDMTADALREFEDEAATMQKIPPHANVISLMGVCHSPYSLVQEFMVNGSLDVWLRHNPGAPEAVCVDLARGIAAGMAHLHVHAVIHRDLAARNVLVSEALDAKIADFGQARADDDDNKTKSDTGPLKWMAPEAILENAYSVKTDSFAFGITLVELFTGDLPYPGEKAMKVATRVAAGTLTHPVPSNAPPAVQEAISACLAYAPADRPDFPRLVKMLR
jgi:serine/threonine protein kinase